MSNSLILTKDIVKNYATLTATNTDADTQYNVTNIADHKYNTLWKALSAGTRYLIIELNKTTNGGFNTGDATGYTETAGGGTLDFGAAGQHSGASCLEIALAGGATANAESDAMTVDVDKTHTLSLYRKVTVRSAGAYNTNLRFLDEDGNAIGSSNLSAITSVDGAYVKESYTVGPGGDEEFLNGTASISVRFSVGTGATLTVLIDDFLFYENTSVDSLALFNHNFNSSNATVSLESSTSDIENLAGGAGWGITVPEFTPSNNKGIIKTYTATAPATAPRAWRLKIVTVYIVPYLGVLWIGQQMTFSNPQKTPLILRDEQPMLETSKSRKGQPLAIVRSSVQLEFKLQIPFITTTWFDANFLPFWDDYASLGSSFPFAWDITNEPTMVYWARKKEKFKLQEPIKVGGYVDLLKFEMEATKE